MITLQLFWKWVSVEWDSQSQGFYLTVYLNNSLARKSVRQSTSEHTRKTNLRLQERQDAPRRRRGAHRDRPLTQEELLAEAKITAENNIRSLGKNMLVKLQKSKSNPWSFFFLIKWQI